MEGTHKVVAVRRGGENDRITAFKLEDGSVLSYNECEAAIENGNLPDLMMGATVNGDVAIRSKRGVHDYSLDSLPTF